MLKTATAQEAGWLVEFLPVYHAHMRCVAAELHCNFLTDLTIFSPTPQNLSVFTTMVTLRLLVLVLATRDNPGTLLAVFYGLFNLELSAGESIYAILQANVFRPPYVVCVS